MGRVLQVFGCVMVGFLAFVGLLHGVLLVRHRHNPETLNSFHEWPVIGGFFPKHAIEEKPQTPEEKREKEAAAWLQDSRNEFRMPAAVTTDEMETLVRELKDARSQADAAKLHYEAEASDLARLKKDVEADRQAVHQAGDEIMSKVNELNASRLELDREKGFVEKTKTQNFKVLASMYEAMPAADAAKRLDAIDDDETAARLLEKMPNRKAGQILAAMETPRAVRITKRLQSLPGDEAPKNVGTQSR